MGRATPYEKRAVKFSQIIPYSICWKLPWGHLYRPRPPVCVCFFSALHNRKGAAGGGCTPEVTNDSRIEISVLLAPVWFLCEWNFFLRFFVMPST